MKKDFLTGASDSGTTGWTHNTKPATNIPSVGPAPVTNATYTRKQAIPLVTGSYSAAKDSQTAYENMASPLNNITNAFSPNILDYYDVYTYHWKLFMVPLSASASGNVLDTKVQTIIVESGVSDLTIDKVEVMCVATPSVECGTGTMTNVKFEIVEPSGAGLLDKIFYETLSLGLGNWQTSPYYLQLEFRARDPDTSASVVNGADGGIGKTIWVWPVTISGSKMNVTEVGTRYEFEAILYNEKAQANCYFSPLQNITLENLTNFDNAMVALEKKLNEDAWEQLIDNYSIPDTFKIIVDPILGAMNFVRPDNKKTTQRGSSWVDLTKKTASFPPSTSVDKMVDSLLGSTRLAQIGIQDSKTPGGNPNTPQQSDQHQMKKLWRIITETKPIAYDAQRQTNANAITIYIVQYDLSNLQANAAQTGQTVDTIPAMKERLNEYRKKKILRKKYNYIFTGLNDQIINLDLSLNYAFANVTSRFGGIYVDSAAGSSKGITNEKNQENEKKAGEIIRNTLKFINDAPKGTNLDDTIATAKKAITATGVSRESAARTAALLDYSRPGQREKLAAEGGLNYKGRTGVQGLTDPATNEAIPQQHIGTLSIGTSWSTGDLNFISDIDTTSLPSQNAKSTAQALRRGKLRPVPTQAGPQEGNFNGIDPAADSGRAKASSMFATALYSGMGADLQTIKMTIKGDPYWLFPQGLSRDAASLSYLSNMEKSEAIAYIKHAHTKEEDYSVNILGSDNFIVIRFRTPRLHNDTTGSVDPFTEAEAFSGIYKVTLVTSKFEGGQFTQELQATLDPLIDFASIPEFLKLLSSLESTNKVLSPLTVPSNSLPLTAVKTEKLYAPTQESGQSYSKPINPAATSIPKSNIPTNTGLTASELLSQQTTQQTPDPTDNL